MRCCINQGIRMTGGAVRGAARGHYSAVIRSCRMQRTPGRAVTVSTSGYTVTACRGCGVETAVTIMAGGTVIMHLVVCKAGRNTGCGSRGSVMAACAFSDTGDRGAVIRLCGRRGMQCCPGAGMTGLAVAGR